MSWWSEKSPGLKILWIWAFGTGAVLVASVIQTRMRDMEKALRQQDEGALNAAEAAAKSPTNDGVVLE